MVLELAFETRKLRTICEDDNEARKEYGDAIATNLMHRLADIRAASSVSDLIAGSPRFIADGDVEQLVVSLGEGYSIEIVANHVENPISEFGILEWDRVSRVRIIKIGADNA